MRKTRSLRSQPILQLFVAMALFLFGSAVYAQGLPAGPSHPPVQMETTQDVNQRLEQSGKILAGTTEQTQEDESRIGPGDLLEITVFEAPEMNRTVRVSANGEISMQLLGPVKAAFFTPQELESAIEDRLRRTYIKDPHVSVSIRDLQSHPVSVVGAVKKAGVFQIPAPKSLIEILSMAEGLADDAGDTVLIMRGAAFAEPGRQESPELSETEKGDVVKVNLRNLLQSTDPSANVPVFPGDIVKVERAGIVYVVGDVQKPGGFVLQNNENITVLQAIALAEGVTRNSAKSQARIIRTDPVTQKRVEIPLDLGKIFASKSQDITLEPKDIVFVPDSSAKSAFYRGAEAVLTTATGVAIYRW